MRWLVLLGCVLLSAAGWWFGVVTGAIAFLLSLGALLLGRLAARRAARPGPLAAMPTWQLFLVPLLGVPLGLALGLLAVVLGPGF